MEAQKFLNGPRFHDSSPSCLIACSLVTKKKCLIISHIFEDPKKKYTSCGYPHSQKGEISALNSHWMKTTKDKISQTNLRMLIFLSLSTKKKQEKGMLQLKMTEWNYTNQHS